MNTAPLSTAAVAEIFALLILSVPAPTTLAAQLEQQTCVIQKTTTTQLPLAENDWDHKSAHVMQTTSIAAIRNVPPNDESDRPTTSRERLIGELRSWGLLTANWDGEGAAAPDARSRKEAVSFVRLLGEDDTLPEPMLHASGHAGLFWKDDSLYADLKFLGDGRVAYYIERQRDKHKGVLNFDSKKMPAVFPALLQA